MQNIHFERLKKYTQWLIFKVNLVKHFFYYLCNVKNISIYRMLQVQDCNIV